MKQIWTVLKFEYLNYLKNKIFLGVTIGVVVVLGVVLSFPRFTAGGKAGEGDEQQPSVENGPIIAVQAEAGAAQSAADFLNTVLPMYQFKADTQSEAALRTALEEGTLKGAMRITGEESFTYFANSISMYDTTAAQLQDAMGKYYQYAEMTRLGLSPEDAGRLIAPNVQVDVVETGKSQQNTFFYTYIIIMMLYMAIILYGQLVATSVASEKSSRAMEMLITSANPVSLIFGKVFGSALAGLTQMGAIFGSAFLFYNLNASYWGGNSLIQSIFGVPLSLIGFSLLFFLLGYFIYAFIFGALGSLATRTEDINTSTMPITIVFIAAFVIVYTSMATGDLNSPMMVVASYIPFTAPMAMLARIAMGSVPVYELLISIAILVGSTIGIGYLSAQIYKMGVLLYGKTQKLSQVLKMRKQMKV